MRNKRIAIYQKTNGKCAYCGIDLNSENFQIDHIIPKSRGGNDDSNNLLPVCQLCNLKKKNKTLEEFREYLLYKLATNLFGAYELLFNYRTNKYLNKENFDLLAKCYMDMCGIVKNLPKVTFYFERE